VNKGFSNLSYRVLDRITDLFPSFGPKIFQKVFFTFFGSFTAYKYSLKKYQRYLFNAKHFEKILVIVDINIGDAVLLQNSIEVLRDYFPGAAIDYMCSRQGGELISELNTAAHIYNIFNSGGIPTEEDINILIKIIDTNDYDVIFNLSPFLKRNLFSKETNIIQLYIPFSVYVCYMMHIKSKTMHVSEIICSFFDDFLKPLFNEKSHSKQLPSGNIVYVSDESIQCAGEFLLKYNILPGNSILMFNPDVTLKYSMIPFDVQVSVLKKIMESEAADYLLIAKAYNYKGIENEILNSLNLKSNEIREKIIIIPHMPLNTFTALIDFCDVFLSGDTGPLHIAASRKKSVSGNKTLRNRTSVISVIGPTNSAMFCYDSTLAGHMPANQDAPSKVFASESPCRNITCLNKTAKTCKEIRCFVNIEPDKISSYIISYFQYLKAPLQKLG